jgi:class 3 adenylate cyclase/hemoglobin-like flavoprotein
MIHFSDAIASSVPLPEEGCSILEASLAAGIPHYHQCKGRARCTTCRVRVLEGEANLSSPDADELTILEKHALPSDIRLACQARVFGPVTVQRVILDPSGLEAPDTAHDSAEERALAVMFCDLRRFTPFAAEHLPQDVIYVLNRYFREICEPVFVNHGLVNQYLGDGFVALFGLRSSDPASFCLDAARAAMRIMDRLEGFNVWLQEAFGARFECGIGLDFGTCVVGHAGHPLQRQLMVIGDSVNRASRIEEQTKSLGVPVLASREFFDHAAPFLEAGRSCLAQLQGWGGETELIAITGLFAEDAAMLVQREFDRVRKTPLEFSKIFYRRLFEADASIAPFFAETDMEVMGMKLVKTLAYAVEHLEDLEAIKPVLVELGSQHAARGIAPRHFDLGGEVLLATLEEFMQGHHPVSRQAWKDTYSRIVQIMLHARPA